MAGTPQSSERYSYVFRQWRDQFGGQVETPPNDKAYQKYAAAVEKALTAFGTASKDWADYISFLNGLLKALKACPPANTVIPAKVMLSTRLSQCLIPSLSSGVHTKALEVYTCVFEIIGCDGLSRDLHLYFPGLAQTLSFASISVRSLFLELLEKYFVKLDAISLRPALESIILALLPGVEEETSEDFDRTLKLIESFKKAVRPSDSQELTETHSTGDDFFWQCFFMASITSQSRRAGALAYLARYLPLLGTTPGATEGDVNSHLATMVTSPEPGLLIRCLASGLADEQVLTQRGFLDVLVSALPLNSDVLQSRVKPADLEFLLKSAVSVVIRRETSLNRRLWAWLLGPEPENEAVYDASSPPLGQNAFISTRIQYFEEHGLAALTNTIVHMIKDAESTSGPERAKPYRICQSLMEKWEIGSLIAPQIFLPVMESVHRFKQKAASSAEFKEVLRSASVFFDGIDCGLIYSELFVLLEQAIAPGSLDKKQRGDKLSLVSFIIAYFNIREEEMVTIHAPLICLAALYMLESSPTTQAKVEVEIINAELVDEVLSIVLSLLELIPERAFPTLSGNEAAVSSASNLDVSKKLRDFYVNEQGNLELASLPFTIVEAGHFLLQRAAQDVYGVDDQSSISFGFSLRVRILIQALMTVPNCYQFEERKLLSFTEQELVGQRPLPFPAFSSMLYLVTQMHYSERIDTVRLSKFVLPLVCRAWQFLSLSEPTYHVETVRCLWHLQTALTLQRRDVEAALSTLMVRRKDSDSTDIIGIFAVLWRHTMQDDQPERRNADLLEFRPRLAGADFYEVMLTQPLFLMLDSWVDERANLKKDVDLWLESTTGLDNTREAVSLEELKTASQKLSETDDLPLCLYYLRTLYNLLTCAGELMWETMTSGHFAFTGETMSIATGKEENEAPLRDLLLRILTRCITADYETQNSEFVDRVSQLQRHALASLRQLLVVSQASLWDYNHIENILNSIGTYNRG